MAESLKSKSLKGFFWTISERFSFQGLSFIVSIILARLLLPEEFGLLGMIAVFIALGNSLRDAGLTSSLIREKELDDVDYSTVFVINIGLSIFFYTVLFFMAPFIAQFFNQYILVSLIRVFSLTLILSSFSAIQFTWLTKQMDYKLQFLIKLPALIIGGIAGIIFAYRGDGVWSLVYMRLIQELLIVVQVWIRMKWKPGLIISKEKFKKHFNFGYKITLAGLIDVLYKNIYNIVIGKYFSLAELGYYTRAQTMKQLPVQNISSAINKVTYPLFAEVQHDNKKLTLYYKRILQQLLFWLAPILTGMAILAEPIFRLLITDKWLPAVPYFQLLCIVGILYPLQSYNLNILKVKGRSDLYLKLEIIKKVIITIGIILVIPYGVIGLVIFQVINSFVAFAINSHYSGKLIGYSNINQLKDIFPILIIASVMGVSVFFLNAHFVLSDLNAIILFSSLGAILYMSLAYIFKIAALRDFYTLAIKKTTN